MMPASVRLTTLYRLARLSSTQTLGRAPQSLFDRVWTPVAERFDRMLEAIHN